MGTPQTVPKPREVSTERPPRTAVIDTPLPR